MLEPVRLGRVPLPRPTPLSPVNQPEVSCEPQYMHAALVATDAPLCPPGPVRALTGRPEVWGGWDWEGRVRTRAAQQGLGLPEAVSAHAEARVASGRGGGTVGSGRRLEPCQKILSKGPSCF